MAFSFRILMSGIIGYALPRRNPQQVVVLLPRADDPSKVGDQLSIKKHYGALFLPDQAKVMLNGCDLRFRFVEPSLDRLEVDETEEGSFFEYTVAHSEISSLAAGVDPQLLEPQPPKEALWARVVFTQGLLLTKGEKVPHEIAPPFEGEDVVQKDLRNQVEIMLDVSSVSIEARSFGEDIWRPVWSSGEREGEACVALVNLEELDWYDRDINVEGCSLGDESAEEELEDLAFRWNYLLGVNYKTLLGKLSEHGNKRSLPFPQRQPQQALGPGPNCYGMRFEL